VTSRFLTELPAIYPFLGDGIAAGQRLRTRPSQLSTSDASRRAHTTAQHDAEEYFPQGNVESVMTSPDYRAFWSLTAAELPPALCRLE
jgi:hypothetical protein